MRTWNSGSYSEPKAGAVVASSDGGYYHVWLFGSWECECTGFRVFGKNCKHIIAARDSVRSGNKKEGVISFFSNPD